MIKKYVKKKVLWIEDGAYHNFQEYSAPIYMSGRYDLTIAVDTSSAIQLIQSREFDIIIVDIRLLPGENEEWIELYNRKGESKISARLGLWLLYGLLSHKDAPIKVQSIPNWINPKIFGIFTVETYGEVEEHLEQLGIEGSAFMHKEGDQKMLLRLIDRINNTEKKNI